MGTSQITNHTEVAICPVFPAGFNFNSWIDFPFVNLSYIESGPQSLGCHSFALKLKVKPQTCEVSSLWCGYNTGRPVLCLSLGSCTHGCSFFKPHRQFLTGTTEFSSTGFCTHCAFAWDAAHIAWPSPSSSCGWPDWIPSLSWTPSPPGVLCEATATPMSIGALLTGSHHSLCFT